MTSSLNYKHFYTGTGQGSLQAVLSSLLGFYPAPGMCVPGSKLETSKEKKTTKHTQFLSFKTEKAFFAFVEIQHIIKRSDTVIQTVFCLGSREQLSSRAPVTGMAGLGTWALSWKTDGIRVRRRENGPYT